MEHQSVGRADQSPSLPGPAPLADPTTSDVQRPQPEPQGASSQPEAPQLPPFSPGNYAPPPIYVTQQVQMAPAYVVARQPKSMALALVLSFFFGPLGLLYSTVTGGIVMLILAVVVGIMTLGLALLFVVPACMIWAAVATNKYNAGLGAPPVQMNQIGR